MEYPKKPLINSEAYLARHCNGMDPNIFFPSYNNKTEQAKAIAEASLICEGCPIQQVCYELAVKNHEKLGIWGGSYFGGNRRV